MSGHSDSPAAPTRQHRRITHDGTGGISTRLSRQSSNEPWRKKVDAPSRECAAGGDEGQRRWTLSAWLNHFNARDAKLLFRCWVATWVATTLVFIQPALSRIGVAIFFAALVLYVVPPASILFVYLLGALSLLLGMCLGWAWGLLTMKAALAA